MKDFLGITKRKWLAFGILSAILSICIYVGWVMDGGHPKILEIFVFFIAIIIGSAVGSSILDYIHSMIKIGIKQRYMAFFLLAAIFFIIKAYNSSPGANVPPSGPLDWLVTGILAAAISFALYIISDFLAGLVFPSPQEKSKKRKVKTKG